MFRNYLKIALRNIRRHKGYSLINIVGLAVGMACTILILLWIQDELSYDRFHENADQIHQVYQTIYLERGAESLERTSAPIAYDLKEDFPEIINSTRIGYHDEILLKYKEKSFIETEVAFAGPPFFEMFTFPFIKGDPKTALSNPFSIVFTEETAEKYFGSEEPLGKVVRLNNEFDFSVTGVIKNVPFNSTRKFKFLIPVEFLRELGLDIDRYTNTSFYTYVLLQEGIPYQEISQKISNNYTKPSEVTDIDRKYYLVPLTRAHLYEDQSVSLRLIYILSFVALLVLMVACINFMNLSTARSVHRAKEVGMRKVVGASRIQLIKQFLGETIILACIAHFIALILVELILPAFNLFSGKHLTIDYRNIQFIFGSTGIILLTGFIAGSYPALFLSSFGPVRILKESLKSGRKGARFRKVLVVIQFSFSIIFIICIAVLYMQAIHMNKSFDKENIVYVPLKSNIQGKYESVKDELLQNTNILNVTNSSYFPFFVQTFDVNWGLKDSEENALAAIASVGFDFTETFNLEMVQGRFYSQEFLTDKTESVVISESVVKKLGLKSPLGEPFYLWGKDYTIIGIVEDYNFFPLTWGSGRVILRFNPDNKGFMFIKIKPENALHTVSFIKSICEKFSPDYPPECNFLNEYIMEEAKPYEMGSQILLYFTALSIFISCLGLFGLSSFMTERRTKEIGIRKVLGASITGIVKLFSKEYVKLLLLSNVIACPVAYFVMSKYLQMFAYRVTLGIWVFLATGAFVFILALLTVGSQAVKAARANPVESLRYE